MIRAVDNKRLDLSEDEFAYYQALVGAFGKSDFSQLFETDKNGQITSITPPVDRQISMGVLFFVLNVMMNQRLRAIGAVVDKYVEKNVAENIIVHNLQERVARLESELLGSAEEVAENE